jgi:pimeloyl-ACP methyl ester carboxylesterase
MIVKLLRTPDDRFAGLPDWPFRPRYAEVPAAPDDPQALRIHYLDEGPADSPPVLLMHGEPSWSYLYRHVIPPLVARGHRVIAPDLAGFGRPFLTAFSDGDPITAGGERAFLRSLPGARSVTITGAGHFLQEDAGPRLAAVITAFIAGQDIEETK